jgi:hypothetical protein
VNSANFACRGFYEVRPNGGLRSILALARVDCRRVRSKVTSGSEGTACDLQLPGPPTVVNQRRRPPIRLRRTPGVPLPPLLVLAACFALGACFPSEQEAQAKEEPEPRTSS